MIRRETALVQEMDDYLLDGKYREATDAFCPDPRAAWQDTWETLGPEEFDREPCSAASAQYAPLPRSPQCVLSNGSSAVEQALTIYLKDAR